MAKKKSEPDTSAVDRVAPKGIDLDALTDPEEIKAMVAEATEMFASTEQAEYVEGGDPANLSIEPT